jgi:hypothetical protein
MPNDELFYRVLKRIDADPKSLDMTSWLMVGECGTIGCFAGHTVLEVGYVPATGDVRNYGRTAFCRSARSHETWFPVSSVAANALGLNEREAGALFAAWAGNNPATRDDVVKRWKDIQSGKYRSVS